MFGWSIRYVSRRPLAFKKWFLFLFTNHYKHSIIFKSKIVYLRPKDRFIMNQGHARRIVLTLGHLFVETKSRPNSILKFSFTGGTRHLHPRHSISMRLHRCWWRMLVTILRCCDDFGLFGHQHTLSFNISVGHQHSTDVINTEIHSPTFTNRHQF